MPWKCLVRRTKSLRRSLKRNSIGIWRKWLRRSALQRFGSCEPSSQRQSWEVVLCPRRAASFLRAMPRFMREIQRRFLIVEARTRIERNENQQQYLDSLRRKDSLREAATTEISICPRNYSTSHFEGSAQRSGLSLFSLLGSAIINKTEVLAGNSNATMCDATKTPSLSARCLRTYAVH